MVRARAVVAAVAAVATLGACSGSGEPFVPALTTTTTTVAPEPTLAPGPLIGRPRGEDAFCDFVATYHERFGRVDTSLADPARLRTAMEEAAAAIAEAADNAPAAIRADVVLLRDAFAQLVAGFRQADFDISRLPPSTLLALAAPQFVAASNRLDAYLVDNCQ